MRQRSTWRWAVLGLTGIAVLIGAWCGWQTWQVYRDLSAAATSAADLQAAVEAGDDAAAGESLATLTDRSANAAERTSGTTWAALEHVPLLGDDARGVRVVSTALSALSKTGIAPLIATAKDLEVLLPRDGAVPVDKIAALHQPVATGSAAFDLASDELAAEDPSSFVGPLKLKFRELAGRVDDAARVLRTTDTALQVMPAMLGADGPRNYLLVVQNNAEIRATGGLPGAVSLLQADEGRVELTRQVATNTLGETPQPVLPLSAAEMEVYGNQLGTYFLDANFTPDWPRASALMKARWEQAYDERIDGVLSLDPVALSYVLRATGPLTIGDVTLTTENVVDELLHDVYVRYSDPAAQDEYFRTVARAVFDRITSGVADPSELLSALSRSSTEGRLLVHSFDTEDSDALAGSQVSGQLVTDPLAAPHVGFYLNDATGAKMSYYLRYDVQINATSCRQGVQLLSGRATLSSSAPSNAATLPDYITGGGAYGTDPGDQLVLVRLYGPVGGTVTSVLLNAQPVVVSPVDVDGRPVVTLTVEIGPGESVDLAWQSSTGPSQEGDVVVDVTPSVVPGNASSAAQTACR